MAALEELLQACYSALSTDTVLMADISTYMFADGSAPAIFMGYAPDDTAGCYVVIRMADNPDEIVGRKRLWYAVDVYDDGASAARALRVCRRIEVILAHLTPTLTTGHFIRAYLDTGPSQVEEGEDKQHFAMDFIMEYSDDATL